MNSTAPMMKMRFFLTGLFLLLGTVEESLAFDSADLDRMMGEVWKAANVQPADVAEDSQFLRRVTLDLIGKPPTLEETIAFLEDSDPDKRSKWISQLVGRREYGEHLAYRWMKLIREGRVLKRNLPEGEFERYFITAFGEDRGWDRIVREMIAAEGSSQENGETYLMVTHQGKQEDLVGTTARLFMGTQMQCSQCHDDKFGRWSQEQFWGMAAFFARTELRPEREMGKKPVGVTVRERAKGEAIIPEGGVPVELQSLPKEERSAARREMMMEMKNSPVEPAFMTQRVALGKSDNRREAYAELLTSPENTLFARTQVNRAWSEMFGRGLIEPVDDLYQKEAGDFEPLLQALADDFVRSGYSLKHLYSLIANTRTYQLSSEGDEEGTEERLKMFAQSSLRPLEPATLVRTLLASSGVEEAERGEAGGRSVGKRGQRILQKFEFAFDNDEGNASTSFEGTIPQALMMMNDELITKAIAPFKSSTLVEIAKRTSLPEERIRLLYLATLCREPSESETAEAIEYLASASPDPKPEKLAKNPGKKDRRNRDRFNPKSPQVQAYQDLYWALLNTSEYLYNH